MPRASRPKPSPHLKDLDDRIIECRGAGHDWPQLKVGFLPKNVRAVPARDGSFQMVITCRNCGRERTRTTLPGGYYDDTIRFAYRGGVEGFNARPGSDRAALAKPDYTAELYRRMAENATLGGDSEDARQAMKDAVAAGYDMLTGQPTVRDKAAAVTRRAGKK